MPPREYRCRSLQPEISQNRKYSMMRLRSAFAHPVRFAGREAAVGLAALSLAVISPAHAQPSPTLAPMLTIHNAERAAHCVAPLVWSNALAAEAQQYANACTPCTAQLVQQDPKRCPSGATGFAHSPGAFGSAYGENLAWGTGEMPSNAVTLWYAEGANYDYNNPIASYDRSSPTVLHFTQIVWRATQQLGCGVANCGGQNLYVCRYTPRGNFNGNVAGVLATNVPRPTCNVPQQVSIGTGTFSAIASTVEIVGARLAPQWGAALFQASSSDADRTALNNCDGGQRLRGCFVVFRSTAKCVAYAESNKGNFSAFAESIGLLVARDRALLECKRRGAPAGSCGIALSHCRQ
jgi:hypothetical protein